MGSVGGGGAPLEQPTLIPLRKVVRESVLSVVAIAFVEHEYIRRDLFLLQHSRSCIAIKLVSIAARSHCISFLNRTPLLVSLVAQLLFGAC